MRDLMNGYWIGNGVSVIVNVRAAEQGRTGCTAFACAVDTDAVEIDEVEEEALFASLGFGQRGQSRLLFGSRGGAPTFEQVISEHRSDAAVTGSDRFDAVSELS